MSELWFGYESEEQMYRTLLSNLTAEGVRYDYLNEDTKSYFRHTASTVVYMSICLSCTVWQLMEALQMVCKQRKYIHYAVLLETILSFVVISCSVLNPLTNVSCEVRFWISIIAVNLGGCIIQSILLFKAYICYNRVRWLIVVGSFINTGYIALTFVYATLGKVPTFKDFMGNCVMRNLEWPALAKLGLDITSNVFLSFVFLMVIYRHYRVFGNSLHKSLLSSGILFSVGVILSNIITAILISCRVMGGLSADLYSFDWVITSYLLIKQFKKNRETPKDDSDDSDDDEETSRMPMDLEYIGPHSADTTRQQSHQMRRIIENQANIETEIDRKMSEISSSTITAVQASVHSSSICRSCSTPSPAKDHYCSGGRQPSS